jgi:cytochrome c peroxidase
MHDGRFKKLSQVLNHYTNGIIKNKTLSKEMQQSIALTSNEKVDIITFLLTLTDKSFLFNPKFSYPKNIFLEKTRD